MYVYINEEFTQNVNFIWLVNYTCTRFYGISVKTCILGYIILCLSTPVCNEIYYSLSSIENRYSKHGENRKQRDQHVYIVLFLRPNRAFCIFELKKSIDFTLYSIIFFFFISFTYSQTLISKLFLKIIANEITMTRAQNGSLVTLFLRIFLVPNYTLHSSNSCSNVMNI